MSLQDFLSPNEVVKYTCMDLVSHANRMYNLHITNDKLVLHSKRGIIFKKDDIIAHRLAEILTMRYEEKGMISKKGILEVHMNDKKLPLEGRPSSIKAVWQELQKYIKV